MLSQTAGPCCLIAAGHRKQMHQISRVRLYKPGKNGDGLPLDLKRFVLTDQRIQVDFTLQLLETKPVYPVPSGERCALAGPRGKTKDHNEEETRDWEIVEEKYVLSTHSRVSWVMYSVIISELIMGWDVSQCSSVREWALFCGVNSVYLFHWHWHFIRESYE